MIMIMMNLFRGSNVSNLGSIVSTILNQKRLSKTSERQQALWLSCATCHWTTWSSAKRMSGLKAPFYFPISCVKKKNTWGQIENKQSCLCQKSCLSLFEFSGTSNGWSNCPTNPISSANLANPPPCWAKRQVETWQRSENSLGFQRHCHANKMDEFGKMCAIKIFDSALPALFAKRQRPKRFSAWLWYAPPTPIPPFGILPRIPTPPKTALSWWSVGIQWLHFCIWRRIPVEPHEEAAEFSRIGCCESRMTKRKHWWTWLTAKLSNWLTD